jgi:hypothetical protein
MAEASFYAFEIIQLHGGSMLKNYADFSKILILALGQEIVICSKASTSFISKNNKLIYTQQHLINITTFLFILGASCLIL